MDATSPCRCSSPGWCDRFRKYQTEHLWELCRCDVRYRRIWAQRLAAIDIESPKEADKAHRVTPPRSRPCIYLGEVIDRLGCACPRRWVRACEVHGQCTLAGAEQPLQRCYDCRDYEADVLTDSVDHSS